jgi:murein DD-endopeptidase MepM/ murein hydrolase activator NlpD
MVKNSFELKMPDAKDEIVYNSQTNNNARLNSLMLHYDLTVQMQESPGGISFNCQKAPEKYDSIINTAVSQDWEFVQFGIEPKIYRYSQDDMKLLISAMINKESGWNPKAVSPKGAIGLMQIMPSTAESDCKISGDVLTDETENIKCGTLYLRKMMDQFLSKAKTEDDLMMFALAAYNWGPGNLENAIKETGADNWQDLSAKASIPKETYNYVLAVTGCMNAYKIRQSIETKTTQLAWPTASRRITSCYGEPRINKNGKPYQHGGIDIGRIENDPNVVKAAADGIVESIVENCREGDAACGGRYGNYILINHGSYKTRYAHLKENGVYVSEDKTVKTGDVIGLTGNTGDSSAMHLHFEVLSMMSKTINPCAFIGCSESTEKKCGTATVDTIDATGMRGFYYYYDDGYDSFEPRPITLEFKVEDYLMPIYCDTQRIYYWTKPRELETARPDLMCFMDDSRGPRKYELYFCQRTVDNKLTEPPAGMDSSHVLQVGGFLKQTGGQIAAAPQSQLTYRCGDQGFVQQ